MNAVNLLAELTACGVVLGPPSDRLRSDSPSGALTPKQREQYPWKGRREKLADTLRRLQGVLEANSPEEPTSPPDWRRAAAGASWQIPPPLTRV